jgi:hypothetical protein
MKKERAQADASVDRNTQETSNREFKPGPAFNDLPNNYKAIKSGGTGIRPCGNGLVHVCARNVTAIAPSHAANCPAMHLLLETALQPKAAGSPLAMMN